MKKTNSYFLSVEGDNEKWYFDYLEKLINKSDAKFFVKLISKVDKSPMSRKKSIKIPVYGNQKIPVFHICDYESNEPEHVAQFCSVIDELKEIKINYKTYNYRLGYSNFAFELWLIMHKRAGFIPVTDRSRYVTQINNLYGTNFTRIKDNKDKVTFHHLLEQITLEDVKNAVINSRKIREEQQRLGNRMVEYKGFSYYRDNPDLTIHECVEIVLKECGVL